MYDFLTKKQLARKYADPARLEEYRRMLASLKVPAAGRIGFDRESLAKELLYTLLDYYSIEEIRERTSPAKEHFRDATKMRQNAVDGTFGPMPTAAAKTPDERHKVDKAAEYPNIRWREMDNPQVRMADSVFSDRINCFRMLHDLEAKTMEDSADREVLGQIVDTAIRHELCFKELRHFNDKGEFLGRHPFITQKDEREEILHLLRTDPEAFFKARKNVELNIARYTSQIKSKKATEEAKEQARRNQELYMAKLQMFREVFAGFVAEK